MGKMMKRIFLRRRALAPGTDQGGDFERALEEEARHMQELDPETRARWRTLSVAMRDEQARGAAGSGVEARFRTLRAASFATAAALAMIVAVLLLRQRPEAVYETGRGEQSSVTLADGSVVTLNHTSTLEIDTRPSSDARAVSLKGEAYFRVQKTGAPFIVSTSLGAIRVLGTEFDVLVRDERLVVAVLSGSVRVDAAHGGPDSSVVLAANQIVTFGAEGSFSPPSAIPFADYPGWLHGRFLFYRTPLAAACREIESRFNVEIRIETPNIAAETVTGAVDGRTPDQVLATLTLLTGRSYRHEANNFIVY